MLPFWTLSGPHFGPPRKLKPVSKFLLDRPRGDRGKCFSGPDGSKSGPRGVQERPIRLWKPPLRRPSFFKGSKRPPRDIQEASRAHLAAILAPFWINFEAISMRCCHDVGHVSSLKAPSPRALDPRPQARRNARERLNPPSHLPCLQVVARRCARFYLLI